MTVDRLLEGKEVCICAGSGGVGKTTVSAAVAMGMAARGLRVAVVTIDPAKRLANSLGLEELGNDARRVGPERFAAEGLEMRGELWALMLDAKRTFDELVERRAPDEATRDAVLSNRIYQELSSAVAGSQEYMGMEKLYELHQDGGYDLLVLDTPPTRNALDFLEAPERLSRFIDSRSLQFFMRPGRSGLKLFGRGTGVVFSVLKRVTGVDLLQDLSEFFAAFGDMAGGFRERAVRVNELLCDRRTTFFLVTSPQRDAIDEAIFFRRRLLEQGMAFGGVVVNRVQELAAEVDPAVPAASDPDTGADGSGIEERLTELLDRELGRKVARTLEDFRAIALHDRASIERLSRELADEPLIRVPYLEEDVHDLGGLAEMNRHLFDEVPVAAP